MCNIGLILWLIQKQVPNYTVYIMYTLKNRNVGI